MKLIIDAERTLGKMKFLSLSEWKDNKDPNITYGTRFNVILIESHQPENNFEKFSVKLPFDIGECRALNIPKGTIIGFENLTGIAYSQSKARPSWEATNIKWGDDSNV